MELVIIRDNIHLLSILVCTNKLIIIFFSSTIYLTISWFHFSIQVNIIPSCRYIIFIIHSPYSRHLGWFHFSIAIVNRVGIKMSEQVPVMWTFWDMPRSVVLKLREIVFLRFWKFSVLTPRVATKIAFLTITVNEAFPFLTVDVSHCVLSHCDSVKKKSQSSFNLHFPNC